MDYNLTRTGQRDLSPSDTLTLKNLTAHGIELPSPPDLLLLLLLDFAFVYMSKMVRRDSYLAHVKPGIKQDTLAAQ